MTEAIDPKVAVEKYIYYRDKIKAREKEIEDELRPYKEAMQLIENYMSMTMGSADNMKFGTGTAYRVENISVRMADRAVFEAWAIQNGRSDFFANNVSKDALQQYLKENGNVPPPGLDVTLVRKVNIRRS